MNITILEKIIFIILCGRYLTSFFYHKFSKFERDKATSNIEFRRVSINPDPTGDLLLFVNENSSLT